MVSFIRQRYATDLSDAQWELLVPLIVLPTGGAPKTTNLREVLNAIFYQLRTGCPWRLLPHDFPPKAPYDAIFTTSNGQDNGKISMTICVMPFTSKLVAILNRV